jgi:hypothetical protein
MKVEKPKLNTFLVRGLQWTTVIERMFHTANAVEREAWVDAIQNVAESLKDRPSDPDSMSVSQLPIDIMQQDNDSLDDDRISRITVAGLSFCWSKELLYALHEFRSCNSTRDAIPCSRRANGYERRIRSTNAFWTAFHFI